MSNKGDKWGKYDDKGRVCRRCGEYKTYDNFHKHGSCPNGRNTVCVDCRKPLTKAAWTEKPLVQKMLDRCKARAAERGLAYDIDETDLHVPDVCPVLGTPMEKPSVDRINSDLGYVKGNVRVISSRANTLKNNAKIWELRKVIEDLERLSRSEI